MRRAQALKKGAGERDMEEAARVTLRPNMEDERG